MVVLVSVTVVVWIGRIRNVLGDEDLDGTGVAWRLVVAFVFLGLAAGIVVWSSRRRRLVGVLCVWTVGFWLVRSIGMLVDDHDLGFKVVHTVLAIGSIAVAAWAWTQLRGPSRV